VLVTIGEGILHEDAEVGKGPVGKWMAQILPNVGLAAHPALSCLLL
jgi:hypothetical protein